MKAQSSFDILLKRVQDIDDRITSESLHDAIKDHDVDWVLSLMASYSRAHNRNELIVLNSVRKSQGLPFWQEEEDIYLSRAVCEVEHLPMPSVNLDETFKIPKATGIYFIKSEIGEVLYIGASTKLKNRLELVHHKVIQAIAPERRKYCSVSWFLYPPFNDFPLSNLFDLEAHFIRKYEPRFNIIHNPSRRKKAA